MDKYAQTKLIGSTQSMNNPVLRTHADNTRTQLPSSLKRIYASE